ncbi:hypothetical protein DPMN_170170 [Dreissena polymorpha]|uniref:Uncharacterized protein n=1 Tax=Dreissena polymorpha TaxID=45954 RepID=A0A9D4IEC5_DREPO|nr:hypothetical protein DPMN_170170 [Dreissena polymorpha]
MAPNVFERTRPYDCEPGDNHIVDIVDIERLSNQLRLSSTHGLDGDIYSDSQRNISSPYSASTTDGTRLSAQHSDTSNKPSTIVETRFRWCYTQHSDTRRIQGGGVLPRNRRTFFAPG